MDYKQKYMKYKNKYLALKSISREPKKNAIFMLCMLKDSYVIGACISAFIHKQYIEKINLDIILNVMVDDYIYNKFKDVLAQYFDRVIKIKLNKFSLSKDYSFAKGKYSWINFSLSKWECLKYEEYDKILFIDVDEMPIKESFYNIFEYKTPAFKNSLISKKCISKKPFTYKINYSFEYYIKNNLNNIGTAYGGLCLLKPSKKLYKDYINFVNNLFQNGIYSHPISGPDETTLFYYFLSKNVTLYDICNDYSVIFWDDKKLIENAKSLNFSSYIKPWIKPRFLCWIEELIWHDIFKVMPKKTKLQKIYEKNIVKYVNKFKLNLNNKNINKSNNMILFNELQDQFKTIISNVNFNNIKKFNESIKYNDYGMLSKKKINKIDDIINNNLTIQI